MPDIVTVADQIYWSYANLARAHSAVDAGANRYQTVHHIVRRRLFKGLEDGRMNIGTMFDDEKHKLKGPRYCAYCGEVENLSLDHLIAKSRAGSDDADNLILACKRCNSSKGARDLLVWLEKNDRFPALLLLRRYLKLVYRECAKLEILNEAMIAASNRYLPFLLTKLPITDFPPLDKLSLWAKPRGEKSI